MVDIGSPSSSSPRNWTHHVFPSFMGADVRKTFLSHIIKEFSSKGITVFIDNHMERGESIGPALIEAVRGSRIAIVLLSKNYASSTWLLDELVEIMKCREELGQTVIPVFYQVVPIDVKKQSGDFGKVFKKTCKGKTKDRIERWKHALKEVALIVGYDSTDWETEAKMIEDITADVSNKLNVSAPCSDFDSLVGMESHMSEMEPLLRFDLDEVRKIGILGPSGIGKTTIARYIFYRYTQDFQLSVFMDNIKRNYEIPACSDEYSVKLRFQKQFISQLTDEKDIKIPHLGVAKDRLKDKKVLIVLDDVDHLLQLEAMAKETCWFGPGSRIIITTQDEKVLRSGGINHIYRVTLPSHDEALQIFCTYAFGQKSPYYGFEKLAWVMTTLSGELPIRLRLMGIYLRGLPKQEWENAIRWLRTKFYGGLQGLLKFNYDGLCDEDKKLAHHHTSSLPMHGTMETFRQKGLSEVRQEFTIKNQDVNSVNNLNVMDLRYTKSLEGAQLAGDHSKNWETEAEMNEAIDTDVLMKLNNTTPSSDFDSLALPNQDVKENVITSERASKGTSSSGLLHKVCIYCADTLQYSFASHLSVDFHRKGIDASVDCNETLDLIEGASAFVVVLSKNYLSSPSCLDKLVRLLQCRIKHVQLVIPVFYGISPSDVAVQEQESDDRIRDWTSALQELRDLPGIHSREESSDCELVEEIVKEVYEKLFPTQQIGVNSRLVEIKQLLCKQPWGIRRIGIWGMPGIGKTTLAKAYFDQVSGGYEASCFIKHFDKAFREKGLYRLWDEHFGKILKDIPRVCSSITRPSLPGEIKHKKRTLVVLDDVQNHLVAESFLGGFHWFGPGSLIIITSRDKRVLRLCQINHVYEVKSLNKNEALQLFSQCAFGEDIREQNLLKLSMEVIDYANGNPLALSFYGEELKGKNPSEMETTFLNFKIRTPNLIHDLLKISYETLNDNEKEIFLDIACFFKGEDVDHVMQLLEGCGLFPHVEIDVLVEKCLVTISENRVEMHRIIQDFGRGINNKETTWSKSGRRLWEPSTIRFLLEDEANEHPRATLVTEEDIKAISLDTTKFRFDVKPTAFVNMLNLRFLKIYSCKDGDSSGLFLRKGLDSLPYGLRLLHWENYPLQYLPQDFEPSHLVELIMPYSQLQKFWKGTKNLEVLKMIMLCHSHKLTEIDDICKAQNIEVIDLEGCTNLQSFPATGQLQHLRVLNLSGCKEIKSFTELSPNIAELNLQGTAITELPRSIGNATSLKKLCLRGCLNLVKLPFSLGNAISLQELNLEFCSSLLELPSSIGNATNLKKLYLTGCSSLDELPSSIRNSTSLISIDLNDDNSLPIVTFGDNSGSKCVEVRRAKRGKFLVLEGEQKNEHYVSLKFHFVNENEHPMSFYTPFDLKNNTAYKVSSEMIDRLDLTDLYVTFIAELIDIVLVNLIPAWKTKVAVNYLIHSQLKQNLRSYRNEAKTQQREEESAAIRDYASVSHSWTSDSSRKDEKGKRVDEIEEKEESSGEEANELVSYAARFLSLVLKYLWLFVVFFSVYGFARFYAQTS